MDPRIESTPPSTPTDTPKHVPGKPTRLARGTTPAPVTPAPVTPAPVTPVEQEEVTLPRYADAFGARTW